MLFQTSVLPLFGLVASINAFVLPRQLESIVPPGVSSFLAVGGSFADDVSPDGQPILCNKITTGASPRCWTVLDLKNFLTNFQSTRAERCTTNQNYNNCILNFVYSNGTRATFSQSNLTRNDCSFFSGQCPVPLSAAPQWTPVAYYVALTFYNVNQYFLAWANAISSPDSSSALSGIIDYSQSASQNLQTIFSKFGSNASKVEQAQIEAISNLLQSGDSTPQSQAVSSSGTNLGTTVSTAVPALSRRLQDALKKAMTDADTFLTLVGNDGIFSGNLTVTGLPSRSFAS